MERGKEKGRNKKEGENMERKKRGRKGRRRERVTYMFTREIQGSTLSTMLTLFWRWNLRREKN